MIHILKGISSAVRQTLCAAAAGVVFVVATGPTSAQTLDVGAHHEHLTRQLEGMPESSLKTIYLGCSREALQRSLGSGEIASCSIAYETLLRRGFGGDFMALLAWSRAQRDDAIAEGPTDDARQKSPGVAALSSVRRHRSSQPRYECPQVLALEQ